MKTLGFSVLLAFVLGCGGSDKSNNNNAGEQNFNLETAPTLKVGEEKKIEGQTIENNPLFLNNPKKYGYATIVKLKLNRSMKLTLDSTATGLNCNAAPLFNYELVSSNGNDKRSSLQKDEYTTVRSSSFPGNVNAGVYFLTIYASTHTPCNISGSVTPIDNNVKSLKGHGKIIY